MQFDHQNEFLVIGHRGAAGLEPENTLPSFKKAFDLGCRAIELDVHRVEEDLAVIHDFDLDRTTNRSGRVSELRLSDLADIDAGNGAAVPCLAQVLDVAQGYTTQDARVMVNIELKGANTAALVANFLAHHQLRLDILVSSFDHDELRAFRALDASTPVAPLFDRWDSDWQTIANELEAVAVNLNARALSARRALEIRRAGYLTFAYTVNRLRRAKTLAGWGVNGVFTDRPDLLLGEISV